MNIRMIEKNSMKLHYLNKKIFYSNLNIEDGTDADYAHAKRVCNGFEIIMLLIVLEEECVTLFIDMQKLITNA